MLPETFSLLFIYGCWREKNNNIVLQCLIQYQPSGARGTRSPPATPHRLKHRNACNTTPPATPYHLQRRTACNVAPPATPHRLPVGPKMADGVWKGVYP